MLRLVSCALAVASVLVALGVAVGGGAAHAAPVVSGDATSLGAIVPDLGSGYAVMSQGALDPRQVASDSPDPSAVAGALSTLDRTNGTYERVWQTHGGLDQVRDLLVRFPSPERARAFLRTLQRSLSSGEIVSRGSVAAVPGARLVTYFATIGGAGAGAGVGVGVGVGVGEAITMRTGAYVALLSFFAVAATNPLPITPSDASRVARSQYAAMVTAQGAADNPSHASGDASAGTTRSSSGAAIGWAVLVVAVLSAAVATPLALHRRRGQKGEDATGAGTG